MVQVVAGQEAAVDVVAVQEGGADDPAAACLRDQGGEFVLHAFRIVRAGSAGTDWICMKVVRLEMARWRGGTSRRWFACRIPSPVFRVFHAFAAAVAAHEVIQK
ncbi:hypothetical protein GCM10017784_10380 [Deinococcus indicus]|nr:hypothetical protein GCM10017784_10380 [Deinococcus indicus]